MTRRVVRKAQVVIGKDPRDELDVEPGDDVSPANHRPPLRGRFRGSALGDALEVERQRDR